MNTAESDPTALGAILLIMGTVTPEDLNAALQFQQQAQTRKPLGYQLITLELCTVDQVMVALAAQERMRANPHDHAVALLDIALARKHTADVERLKIQQAGERIIRKTPEYGHTAITVTSLAETPKKD